MKPCPNCKAMMKAHLETCWNCNYSFVEPEEKQPTKREISCLRCNILMTFSGNYKLQENTNTNNYKIVEMYRCTKCDKIELFSIDN